jgi:hypothetical protein
MSEGVSALMAELEAAARAAWQEEEALRTRLAREVAQLERRRAFAHRRMNFVRVLADAAKTDDLEEAAAAQRAAVRLELGWGRESEFHRAVLDRLRPVARLVWQGARGRGLEAKAINAELEAFEAWFEAAHRQPFYALFDREPPEVGLVET